MFLITSYCIIFEKRGEKQKEKKVMTNLFIFWDIYGSITWNFLEAALILVHYPKARCQLQV